MAYHPSSFVHRTDVGLYLWRWRICAGRIFVHVWKEYYGIDSNQEGERAVVVRAESGHHPRQSQLWVALIHHADLQALRS